MFARCVYVHLRPAVSNPHQPTSSLKNKAQQNFSNYFACFLPVWYVICPQKASFLIGDSFHRHKSMAMGTRLVLRSLLNELSLVRKCFSTSSNCKLRRGRLYQNARCSASFFGSSAVENQQSHQEESREERFRKQRRNIGLIIGSSVGLISSLYFLFRRLNQARAEGKNLPIDFKTDRNVVETQDKGEDETEGKQKKDKHGFKERRVIKTFLIFLTSSQYWFY